ncbi:hypothetical protein [Streptomyces megasporus]|uniref:hypothetical protein n=1 Tax=Streptomyces megasporus TaxID=44060 RepID=UPI0004E11C74|nr:hypothetical protein [Streptomyces megasporus]
MPATDAAEKATKAVYRRERGARRVPALVPADGTVLVEPTDDRLRDHLTAAGRSRTEGRDTVRAPSTVADLRRTANPPATRCLLAGLFTAMARRAQQPPRTPRTKPCSS